MKKNYNFATWIRIFGVILILMCHFTPQSGNVYLKLSSQFFNIGVPIFFILSGFLFGAKREPDSDSFQWYDKRIKRIFIPYEMFIVVLLIIHILYGTNIQITDWLCLMLGM